MTLKEKCAKNEIEFIDNYDCFLLASGEMPSTLFHHDKLHLIVYCTRGLLSGIDMVIPVMKYTFRPYKLKPKQGRHTKNISRPTRKGRHMSQTFCHIYVQNQANVHKSAGSTEETPRDVTLTLGMKLNLTLCIIQMYTDIVLICFGTIWFRQKCIKGM